jgi:hypothetical protein
VSLAVKIEDFSSSVYASSIEKLGMTTAQVVVFVDGFSDPSIC